MSLFFILSVALIPFFIALIPYFVEVFYPIPKWIFGQNKFPGKDTIGIICAEFRLMIVAGVVWRWKSGW